MNIEIKKRFNYKDLPDMKDIFTNVDKIAKETKIGSTLFFQEHGVKSELEYKKKAMAEGKISKHSHLGWNSWDETAKNIEYIYETLRKRGSYLTRMGIIFDWVMGVPEEYRSKMSAGTGLILKTPEEWKAVGQIVPIQPHMSDHMIGSPNALQNCRSALEAGVTSIGNVSHYFTYEYPGVELERERTINSITAFALMGKYDGTIIHSNLDDGFGSQFHDLANLTGWAMMERHLVETLLGARMTFSYGNLFSDPMSRIVFNMAMEHTNVKGTPGTMIFGNTIDYGLDYNRNYGALSSFSLADAIFQRHKPSGHAISAVPVSEASRIPTPDEIVDGHLCIDMMIEKSALFEPYVNWAKLEDEKNILVNNGKVLFENMVNGLDDLGININHPGEMFAALKYIGPEQLETYFGVGKSDKSAMRNRIPVRPTDIIKTITTKRQFVFDKIKGIDNELDGIKVILGTTDIHDYGKEIVKTIVTQAGATVFDLGTYVTPSEIMETVVETEAKAIIISTYNGIALTIAREIVEGVKKNNLDAKLIMGGLLNENMDGSALAVDVTEDLRKLGVNADNDATKIVEAVLNIYNG